MTNPAERLREIQEEMLSLLDEAVNIVRRSGNKFEYDRAKAYWIAYVKMALTNDHEYVGSSTCSMEDTIDALDIEPEEGNSGEK